MLKKLPAAWLQGISPRSLIKPKFNSVYEAKRYPAPVCLKVFNGRENFSVREQYGIRNAYATIINSVRWIVVRQ